MSTVATNIRSELSKGNITVEVVSLVNFYKPLRGKLNKQRSRAGSLMEEEKKDEVLKEINYINENTDFDDPKQINFDLLIVSAIIFILNFEIINYCFYRVYRDVSSNWESASPSTSPSMTSSTRSDYSLNIKLRPVM